MSKYIDQDRVLEYIIYGVVGKDITCGELKRAIKSLPTIEIVRCKDCEHYNFETHGCKRSPSIEPWWEDDFCSYGERQVASKLNNADDSLLTADSDGSKEQKSKLESKTIKEYIPKDEVLDIIKSMPMDLIEEYVYELDGIWLDDDDGETSTNKVDAPTDTPTNAPTDLISRQAAIEAMWKALYAYEDLTEKQFMEHEELELNDWFQHRIFVQRMHEECMKSVESLPPVTPTEQNEEDILKFYYVESLDEYWIGQRCGTRYYGKWTGNCFTFTHSRYLPWGEHVVAPDTLWKEHTYPSEPKEIPFNEWLQGFLQKECQAERSGGDMRGGKE